MLRLSSRCVVHASAYFPDGRIFYGKVAKTDEKNTVLVGRKGKAIKVYTFPTADVQFYQDSVKQLNDLHLP
jgi:hypothetical protein